MRKIPNYRWWIAGFLALTTAFSYFDRQSFPVAVVAIAKSIPLTNQQYSELQMLFLCAYSVMYAAGGKAADRIGTRFGYFAMILLWSVATILHGFMNTVFGLGIARFLLGLGEGGGFPCSAKAISEWFPQKERSAAFGVFNAGSSIGAVAAPPIIAVIAITLNWRWVFFLMGSAGVLWAVLWLRLYDLPSRSSLISANEQRYIQEHTSALEKKRGQRSVSWRAILSFRQMWALCFAKFLTDAAWFFFIFWLPKYLADVRHLNIKQIGYYAWIPYVFAGVGSFAGGLLSSYLIKRDLSIGTSRKLCLCISATVMPIVLLITRAPLSLAIVFFSIALFGHQFWSAILQTIPTDLFPSSTVGTAAGLMGSVGSFGAALANLGVGVILGQYHSYARVFLLAGIVYPISFIVLIVLIPKIQLIKIGNNNLSSRESLA